ncbi:phospholipase D-like domain-containing protein [bacterium]|nr:phospholipase D-like domain-containing protein [bacterium]
MRLIVNMAAMVGAVWVLWMAYTLVAPEREDELPSNLVGQPLESVSGIVDVIAQYFGVPVSTNSQVEPLFNGDQFFPPMLEAIHSAEDSIDFLTFIYWTGDIADEFAEALAEAAKRGVTVRVILDGFGSFDIKDGLVQLMQSAGVEVAWYHPLQWYDIRRLNKRTHRKTLIIDREIGFTGGAGIAAEWTGTASKASEWRDNHFRITGSAVQDLETAFAQNWLSASGEMLVYEQEIDSSLSPPDEQTPTERLLTLSTSPQDGISSIALVYWTAITSATQRVDISTPYFLPDLSLKQTMIDAANNGLDIRLLLPGEHNDSVLIRTASVAYYKELLEAGVRIFEFQTSMMHTKLMLLDDDVSIFGSANFDNRSFSLNSETILISDSQPLFQQLHDKFEKDLEEATEITLESDVLPSGIDWLLSQAALLLREQL